jgi:hypothetical protein
MNVNMAQYNRLASLMGQRQAEAGQARAANERQRSMFLEGLSSAASGAASSMSAHGFG